MKMLFVCRCVAPPDTVMEMRGRQASFAAINDELRTGKTSKANQKGETHAKRK